MASQQRRGLKNLIREADAWSGVPVWKLSTSDGEPVPAFTAYCRKNINYAPATQKRYAEVVSRFLDYLFEARIFTHPVSAKHLNAVIEAYPLLLRDGSAATVARMSKSHDDSDENAWITKVASALSWPALSPRSFANTLAAVNRFLQLCESLSRETTEKAKLLGLQPSLGIEHLIDSLAGTRSLSRFEIAALKQNSMLGSVIKFAPHGIARPKRITARRSRGTTDTHYLDFPLDSFQDLLAHATSWRDKTLWLLLGASGIRPSEARNVLLEDVDVDAQTVYILDPLQRRFPVDATDPRRSRFKGREMAITYLFSPLRQQFFKALEQYLRHEFVPRCAPGSPQYLFQYVEPTRRGEPLVDASDSALAKVFKRALQAANIAPPLPSMREWTPHSLRHMYGVYMLNDYPVNAARGEYGLSLVEVQMLMGHRSIRSTAHYARRKRRNLEAKLRASDEAVLGLVPEEFVLLPPPVRRRLELL